MPLRVLPLKECHLQRYTEISANSFHESGCVTHRAIFPRGVVAETQRYNLDSQLAAFRTSRGVFFVGVFDLPDDEVELYEAASPRRRQVMHKPGSIRSDSIAMTPPPSALIAVARLRLEDHMTFPEAHKKRMAPPGSNAEAFDALFSQLGAAKIEVMGRKTYWLLDSLTTATEAQGRGAGRMIVEWMTKVADETVGDDGKMGVECFLEATEMGKPLYIKYGFSPVREITIRATRFGQVRDGSFSIMVRPRKQRTASVKAV